MLKTLFHRFKSLLVIATVLSSLSAIASVAMLTTISKVIAEVGAGSADLSYSFMLFIALILSVMAFSFLSQFLYLRLTSTVVYDVRKTILERVLATSYDKIDRVGGHRIMATMRADIETLSKALLIAPNLISNAIIVLTCTGYMLYQSWVLSILVATLFACIIVVAKITLRYLYKYQKMLREYEDAYFLNLKVLTDGGKEIHLNLNRRRYFYEKRMMPLFDNIRKKTVGVGLFEIGLNTYTSTLIHLTIGLMVYGASILVPNIDIKVVVGFVLVILYMVGPLGSLVGMADDINDIRVSLDKIQNLELADASEFSLPASNKIERPVTVETLSVEQAFYRYPEPMPSDNAKQENSDNSNHKNYERTFTLGPASAEFKAGELTLLVGANGSGKTTFAKMLTGLYSLDSGSICLDGKVVQTDLSMISYQSMISIIFADAYVFDSVLDRSGIFAEDKKVNNIIKILKLEEKVSYSNGLLSSTNLSLGQRKRLALLGSFSEDAQICIYDELAADQDPEFKHLVYTELLPELKREGKIVIAISHDDSYFGIADKIIRFENGKINC